VDSPTKHDDRHTSSAANLLDGFFNLWAPYGQGILLVGMMTEAVARRWLSDRTWRLQNVLYVFNASVLSAKTRTPGTTGSRPSGPSRFLGEASTCSTDRRPAEGGLLAAIVDGTFGDEAPAARAGPSKSLPSSP